MSTTTVDTIVDITVIAVIIGIIVLFGGNIHGSI